MADDQVTYPMIRAVRDETGASHEECRRVLEEAGGDVAGAAALWFARRGQGAAAASVRPSREPHLQNAPQSGRS
jgi:translation elongation factor EF-Ts